MRPFLRSLFLILPFLLSSAGAADRTLTVVTQDLEGTPIEGVAVQVTHGEESVDLTTDATGFAKTSFERKEGTHPEVEIVDDGWQVASEVQSGGIVIFQLFSADRAELTSFELRRLAELEGRNLSARRSGGEKAAGEPGTPHVLRLSAFLRGWRDLDPRRLDHKYTNRPTVLVTVPIVDELGNPVVGRSVHLYTYNERSGEMELFERERSEENGIADFQSVTTGHIYRIVVAAEGDDRVAESGFLIPEAGEDTKLEALVLRQPGRAISGIVIDGDMPLQGVRISARAEGDTELTTTTDRFGYFYISPVVRNSVGLTLQRNGQPPVQTTIQPGGDEAIIPLSLLEEAERRQSSEQEQLAAAQRQEIEDNRRAEEEALQKLRAEFDADTGEPSEETP